MKKLFFTLSLAITSVAVFGAKPQIKPNQDKPAEVILKTANGSAVFYYSDFTTATTSWNWTNSAGGNYSLVMLPDGPQDGLNIYDEDFYSWGADGSGSYELWEVIYRGNNPPDRNLYDYGTSSFSGFPWEIGSLSEPYDPPWGSVSRNSKTTIQLKTGGKNDSKHKNVFALTAGATGYRHLTLPYAEVIPVPSGPYSIPASSIQVAGKSLGADGLAYAVFPDNTTVDVTPQTPASYYSFDVSASKHHPYITANGINLETNTPEFCVGQKVDFALAWDSSPGYVDAIAHWSLPGKFVNESWRALDILGFPTGSLNYRINYDLLTNLTTSCWYQNQPGGTVSIGTNLRFSNGQNVSIAAKGDFTIYRPNIYLRPFAPGESEHFYTISEEIPGLGSCKLKLGRNNDSGEGDMRFGVRVNSKFHGAVGLTQLITANYVNPTVRFSDERCDGTEFYSGPWTVSTTVYGQVDLDDGPSSIWMSPNWVDLSCRDFVRFQPDGGIFVTLGIVTWDTVGMAQTFMGDWSITDDATSGPNGPDDSDEFPVWTKNQGGMH